MSYRHRLFTKLLGGFPYIYLILSTLFLMRLPCDIRIKSHRIGIETVLYEYIYRHRTPEEIQQIYPSLTLEEVYGTILYYLRNKEAISKYIERWLEWGHQMREEQRRNPPPIIGKLMDLKAEKAAQLKANAQISNR